MVLGDGRRLQRCTSFLAVAYLGILFTTQHVAQCFCLPPPGFLMTAPGNRLPSPWTASSGRSSGWRSGCSRSDAESRPASTRTINAPLSLSLMQICGRAWSVALSQLVVVCVCAVGKGCFAPCEPETSRARAVCTSRHACADLCAPLSWFLCQAHHQELVAPARTDLPVQKEWW